MKLGAAAIAHPLKILDATKLHTPLPIMLAALVLVILLAVPKGYLGKAKGGFLVAIYPLAMIAIFF